MAASPTPPRASPTPPRASPPRTPEPVTPPPPSVPAVGVVVPVRSDMDPERAKLERVCAELSRGRGGVQTRSSPKGDAYLRLKESRLYPAWTEISLDEAIERFGLEVP